MPRQRFSLANVSLRVKFFIAPVIAIILLLVVSGVSILGISQLDTLVTRIATHNAQMNTITNTIRLDRMRMERDVRQVLLVDQAGLTKAIKSLDSDEQTFTADFASYTQMATSPSESAIATDYQKAVAPWFDTFHRLKALINLQTPAAFQQATTLATTQWQTESEAVKAISVSAANNVQQIADKARAEADATFRRALAILGIAAVLAIGLTALVSIVIARVLIRQIAKSAATIARISAGDLTATTENTIVGRDEISQIGQSVDQMSTSLRQMISNIRATGTAVSTASTTIDENAQQVREATNQIADAIQHVAGGAQVQNQQLHGASSEIDTFTQQCETMQNEAQTTTQMMHSAHDMSLQAAQKVRQLGNRSEQIGNIIQTIDTIADQTNLLALNAAIEAARAGDHGRGFAVVADEVRKLAVESAQATQEIAEIIRETQAETNAAVTAMERGMNGLDEGLRHAEQTGTLANHMHLIAQNLQGAITAVTGISEDNSAAAEEVSAATEEVHAQMGEAVGTSEQLHALAKQLNTAIGAFRVDETSTPEQVTADQPTKPLSLARAA